MVSSIERGEIRSICRHEMDLAIQEEIKVTILYERGEDFHKQWSNKTVDEKDKI